MAGAFRTAGKDRRPQPVRGRATRGARLARCRPRRWHRKAACGAAGSGPVRGLQGRSGAYRVLIAHRAGEGAVVLYGFGKNQHGFGKHPRHNIDPSELLALRKIGAAWLGANPGRIAHAIQDGVLQEVDRGKAD